ncbi:paraquat-inducible protein A [uncultured Desulfosarcina sp.]|uniref:paraquat-inducible protein A n=1 Tax=uncultured Desulfosarcina sp. TaxID=218289 RepID=UPI0037493DE5
MTAKSAGLALCPVCHECLRWQAARPDAKQTCPRCGATVRQRHYGSIGRSWALTLTALILLIPANLLPIMTMSQFGEGEASTIVGGVVFLVHHGMVPIALIVFIASFAVPFLKITGIVVLLLSVQFKWETSPRQRTLMYRMVEYIGKWSMLDIFVIAILAKLVDLGKIASIEGNPAAVYFGLAVIMTMLAAMVFDQRLIWDATEKKENDDLRK